MSGVAAAAVMEFVGTFALIFIGAGSILTNQWTQGAVGLVGVALAHGLTIATFASACGIVSGGQFNPAVTVSLLVGRKIVPARAIVFIVAQLAGAIAGAFLLKMIYPADIVAAVKLGTPMPGLCSPNGALAVEVVLTFLLVFVIWGTGVDERFGFRLGGLAIGLTVTLAVFMGGPLSGASMNPARTLGPALAGGHWDHHWVYWVGPLLGAVLAGALWSYGLLAEAKKEAAA